MSMYKSYYITVYRDSIVHPILDGKDYVGCWIKKINFAACSRATVHAKDRVACVDTSVPIRIRKCK